MRGTPPPVAPDGAERQLPVTEHGRHVLVAPGGKYRVSGVGEDGRLHEVSDGETAWVIHAGLPWQRATAGPSGGQPTARCPACWIR